MADYKITKLMHNGSEYVSPTAKKIDYIIVGGGGGGGTYYSGMYGGGGGGGEVVIGSTEIGNQTNIYIGLGGYGGCQTGGFQCGQKGMDTHLGMITARGGYGGGQNCYCKGGTSGSGCCGGCGYGSCAGGGGGGASACGCNAPNKYCGGVGGAGLCGYGGGGAGGGCSCRVTSVDGGGYGQRCMGGNGVNGGGGGGTYQGIGGTGGDGLVVLCYKTDGSCGFSCATGGTITSSGGYTVHCFTSDGTFCILS